MLTVAEGLAFSKYGRLVLVGDYTVRKIVRYENDSGWMGFWELKSEVLGSF
jgi:hypothetical protein